MPAEENPPLALSTLARIYLAVIYALAVGAVILFVVVRPSIGDRPGLPDTEALLAFALLVPLTAAAQLFMVDAPNRQSYHATPAFLLAAILLLEPPLLVLLVVLAMLPEWLKYRYPWYIQTFNMATYLLNVLVAWANFRIVAGDSVEIGSWQVVWAALVTASTLTVLNHAMVATVLRLARGIGIRESGILAWQSVGTDISLACVGVGMAVMWTVTPPFVALAIAPLFLFYRALFVPGLQEEAYHDAKTGLLTARRSLDAFREEVALLQREPRPTAVIMADLDLLRNVNNSLGHLAGDEVLRVVGGVLRRTLRGDDVAGRFGGEEFFILLHDTDAERALIMAGRLRAAVEATAIPFRDSPEPLRVTISLGVAAFPEPCRRPDQLLYEADVALYRSKLNGRNRVTLAAPEDDGTNSRIGSRQGYPAPPADAAESCVEATRPDRAGAAEPEDVQINHAGRQ